ncbi:MAG: 4-(cytidine 5'-diphospho)-2-C-methyl-D-erythritol kinase [Acetobacteraceae bacterium]|nr:4-(cytidine 5'-diphospho)-2-C-methyl-D-erythritol kinase [Acetobacteraceae bacterium]
MTTHEAAPAKVNLYLHVTGRRPDGYHLLDSLAVFGPAADRVSAGAGEGLTLTLDGPFGVALQAEADNLVLRAARLLAESAGVEPRAALRLTKRLPVASGIGGGSADAAAALRALARLWGVSVPLEPLAAKLGADVPVCVASRPARMRGVGEVLDAAPGLPRCALLLVNPGVALPTPEVFWARQGGFRPEAALPASWPDAEAMARDLRALANDLEPPAIALRPVIAEVLAAIAAQPGCLLARMSGSGATCFGLFADAALAEAAARALPAAWWREAGGLYEAGPASLKDMRPGGV